MSVLINTTKIEAKHTDSGGNITWRRQECETGTDVLNDHFDTVTSARSFHFTIPLYVTMAHHSTVNYKVPTHVRHTSENCPANKFHTHVSREERAAGIPVALRTTSAGKRPEETPTWFNFGTNAFQIVRHSLSASLILVHLAKMAAPPSS
jgi:hypothetical protein